MYVMRRTTVFLEEALLKRARRLADRDGKSFAQVVREALAAYVAAGPAGQRDAASALPSVAGLFDSGHTDTSERVDELLWKDPHA